jgi:hypothetical protein
MYEEEASSTDKFQEHLQCLVMSLRQSEASRQLVKQMKRAVWRHRSNNEASSEFISIDNGHHHDAQVSFSVDETRRFLLALMEQKTCITQHKALLKGVKGHPCMTAPYD